MKSDGFVYLLALILGLVAPSAWAIDPPHDTVAGCMSCHLVHHSVGASLTTDAINANLCLSCHVSGGSASSKAFINADEALPWPGLPTGTNASGTSHRWDSGVAGHLQFLGGAITRSTGTITSSGVYTGYYAKTYTIQIQTSGAVGTAKFFWSATSPGGATGTNLTTGTNVALDAGIFLTFADGTNNSFQAADTWNLFVHPDLRNPTNTDLLMNLSGGAVACSTCHNQEVL